MKCVLIEPERAILRTACVSVGLQFSVMTLLKPDTQQLPNNTAQLIDEAVITFWKHTRPDEENSFYTQRNQSSENA